MKKTFSAFLTLLLTFNSWPLFASSSDSIQGYRLVKKERLEEFESDVRIFEHLKTGAKLIYLSNTDDEKVFSITFKTHQTDNTGIPHIIEHSVLCGSKKFPLKDPFVQLLKSSLKTFLNAMTFSDRTLYPVASRNDKDFTNLMTTYLDAVFYPRLLENEDILKQEGWHFEYDPKEKKLGHSGVVYGEMKGAYSNPERLIWMTALKTLYPNTVYSFDSGGDPEDIPNLTQEDFVSFHNKYYHPSNAIIYFYGNGDIKKHLSFLDEEYLSKFDRRPDSIQLPNKPQIKSTTIEKNYASNELENEASFFSQTFSLNTSKRDPKVLLALDILSYYLGQSDAAPLKQLILDNKLAKEASVDFEPGIAWPILEISAKNADASKKELFFKLVRETLLDYAHKGLDHELLEAALKRKEFFYREFNSNQPIGLTINYYVNQNWLYGDDPLSSLHFDKLFTELKNDLKKGYFENVLKELVENNSNSVQIILKPNKDLAKTEEKAYADKMEKKLKSLSEKELQSIIESTKNLKIAQETPDSPEVIKTLPTLKLSDLNKKAEIFPRKIEKKKEITLVTHPLPTKGITYLNLYFDASTISQDLISYLPLFNQLMGSIDTKKYPYNELSKQIDLKSGGIGFDLFSGQKFNDMNVYHPRLLVTLKAFTSNYNDALALLSEILLETKWENKKRIIEIIQKNKANWDSSLSSDGMNLAETRLQAHFSQTGFYQEQLTGISQYLFIKDLEKNIEKNYDEFIFKMKKIQDILINQNNLVVSLASEKKNIEKFKKTTLASMSKIPSKTHKQISYQFELLKGNEALIVPGKVQYVVKAGKLDNYRGELQLINQSLRTDYLWNKVRVQNGAYGSFSRFKPTGVFQLFSYRDPNLEKTLQIFDEMPDYVSQLKLSDEEITPLIIGTISNFDKPLRPKDKAKTATELYLVGISDQWRQNERDQVLATTSEKIQNWGKLFKLGLKGHDFVVSGTKSKIDESQKLFQNIVDLTK